MAKETAVEREYNKENLLIIKNFFTRLFGKCGIIFRNHGASFWSA
jgi:hypothetical protein